MYSEKAVKSCGKGW